jgi:hypothetical protein
MHSLVSPSGVGLLLFDEPSASLDPTAEHGAYFWFYNIDSHKFIAGLFRFVPETLRPARQQDDDLFISSIRTADAKS